MEIGAVSSEVFNITDPRHVAARVEQAEALQRQFGLTTADYFRDDEVKQFVATLEKGEVVDQLALLQSLSAGAGDRVTAMLGELSTENHYMAQVGWLVATGEQRGAEDALIGKKSDTRPSKDSVAEVMQENVGNLLTRNPDVRNSIAAIAMDIYITREGGGFDPKAEIDGNKFELILQEVIGSPLMEMNGTTFILPSGVDENDIKSLEGAFADTEPEVGAEVLRMISTGGPAYWDTGAPAVSQDIRNFTIENIGNAHAFRFGHNYLGDETQPDGIFRFDLEKLVSSLIFVRGETIKGTGYTRASGRGQDIAIFDPSRIADRDLGL